MHRASATNKREFNDDGGMCSLRLDRVAYMLCQHHPTNFRGDRHNNCCYVTHITAIEHIEHKVFSLINCWGTSLFLIGWLLSVCSVNERRNTNDEHVLHEHGSNCSLRKWKRELLCIHFPVFPHDFWPCQTSATRRWQQSTLLCMPVCDYGKKHAS